MTNVIKGTPEAQTKNPVLGLDGLKIVIAGIIENADEAASTSTSCS